MGCTNICKRCACFSGLHRILPKVDQGLRKVNDLLIGQCTNSQGNNLKSTFRMIIHIRVKPDPDPGWRFVDSKSTLNPPVAYATDRFKVVVLLWSLVCVVLWFFLWAVSCGFSVLFSIPRLGKRELVYELLVHLFVYIARVKSFFSSSWCKGLDAACDCGTPWTFLKKIRKWSLDTYFLF